MGERDEPRAFGIEQGSGTVPVGPGHSSFDPEVLDFGHYAGRRIAELAETDPDYLHWLARHPAGTRYRTEISRVLAAAVPRASDWQR